MRCPGFAGKPWANAHEHHARTAGRSSGFMESIPVKPVPHGADAVEPPLDQRGRVQPAGVAPASEPEVRDEHAFGGHESLEHATRAVDHHDLRAGRLLAAV